ncbi:hypothetical protein [Facklamia hominis]|uniref:Uncharacterized protein n=1 Tax=Facklamia hominis CCUG 36813 TaxID=883111 RepID=K1LWJ9_9LACT|nr:hypothetical protein [Facklamia hominis]EKB54468.1 hypothetical protein HMPREF9706_00658 [Facklamia hominis CCUG 36813]
MKLNFTSKEILHNLPYTALTVTVDKTTTGTVDEKGRKILPAGTVVFGDGASVFKDRTKKVKKSTGEEADGIILHDVDVTDGDKEVAMVYQGTVRSDRVIDYADTIDKALPQIKFIKGI